MNKTTSSFNTSHLPK